MPAADRFATLIDPVTLRLARSPLPAWLAVAGRTLRALLPAPWRALLDGDAQRLFLLRHGDEVELIAGGPRADLVLGHLPLGDADLLAAASARAAQSGAARWLLLPSSQVLRRALSLPIAAEPRLREVLYYEAMGRGLPPRRALATACSSVLASGPSMPCIIRFSYRVDVAPPIWVG